jgi:hypothetical protein
VSAPVPSGSRARYSKPVRVAWRRFGRLAIAAGVTLASACGTDAVGVETCRRIETARCNAAEACGEISNAAACERFYRDQCLHGLSVPEPSERQVDACTRALEAVAECARSEDTSEDCENACDAVTNPELLADCAFLADEEPEKDEEPPEDQGDGGTSGAGGQSASGDSGTGGTPAE